MNGIVAKRDDLAPAHYVETYAVVGDGRLLIPRAPRCPARRPLLAFPSITSACLPLRWCRDIPQLLKLARLIAEHGWDIPLPKLRHVLAACPRGREQGVALDF